MTWLYPSFLWALFALSIPVIVHLFNFRRYKRIVFTNLKFLSQINQQTKSGNQLKKYLILASRLLALTFLVFAFAQPLKIDQKKTFSTGKNLVSILIDNSFSMNRSGAEGPLLEAAKNRARSIINASKNNDEFQIITADLNATFMHTVNKQTALETIDKIKISAGAKPMSQLMEVQQRLLAKSNNSKRRFVISDFQKNDIPLASSPDTTTSQTWIQIPGESTGNISIDTCYLSSPILQVGESVTLAVQVSNYSETEVQGLTIELNIDNQPKGIATFDIKPFAKTTQTINFIIDKGGEHRCVLQHSGDNLSIDDKLYFSINLKTDLAVLNIFDQKERYINAVFNETKGFKYTGVSSGNIQYNGFSKANLICIEGNPNLSNGLSNELKNYVAKGGNLFIFPQAGLPQGGLQTLSAALGFSVSDQPVIFNNKVSSIDIDHHLFNHIFEKIPKNPDLPMVQRYYSISSPQGQSVMRLSNGQAFLMHFKSNKGNVYICASPLDNTYSNFQNHAFFVPVLMKAVLMSGTQSALYYQCGQTGNIPITTIANPEKGITLKSANASFFAEVININGEMFLNTNGEIEQAGWYDATMNNTDSSLFNLSFNMNRKESDTRTFSTDELEKKATLNGATLFTGSAEQLGAEYATSVKGTPLWKWCIIFVLIFLMIEILLIRFFKTNAKLSA
ncbi:MAG: BatA and WFA domain-containing protein [Bacteroidota bacterium]